MKTQLLTAAAISGLMIAGLATPAVASNVDANSVQATTAVAEDDFSRFAPSDDVADKTIDYSIWDDAMKNVVVSFGPSLRQGSSIPPQSLGTRRQYGHTSRYRLEGNRIMFSFLETNVIESFGEYRKDLEQTADIVDIQSLSRNEQLAYWMNLHNVAVIEQIANQWPVRRPSEMMIDGVPLDEARFITVNGIAMSPKDIRTQIVYKNWNDPKVMYGFWRGDIGGPSIQREAFNADNVARLLDRSAREFVNSLRGTEKRGDRLLVSEIYNEAAPYFFADFGTDVRAHVNDFASEEVKELVAKTNTVEASIYEFDIADMAGGLREPSYTNITTTGNDGIERSARFRIPQSMINLLRERDQKFKQIFDQGRTGTVTFSNIKLPGDEEEKDEVE